MTRLKTWAGRSLFEYEGCIPQGTTIHYGKNSKAFVSADAYKSLLKNFQQSIITVGTSRTDDPAGSLGEWLKANVTRTAIASYVVPILINEGYGERVDSHSICLRKGIRSLVGNNIT